ncbi:MAG: hypothetical protein OEZ04_09405 [Nitrospinota bacterium]|nr:hypothetical protein [Nitrospinota bacterium]
MRKTTYIKILPILAIAVAAGMFTACGDVAINTDQLGMPNNNTGSGDLSGKGQTPDPSWHTSYLAGAHGSFLCTDCHVSTARADMGQTDLARSPFRETPRDQICSRCHMGDYNRTSLFNHTVAKTGTYCNSCHYSDSFTAHTRISADQYHGLIGGSCASCHAARTPANHRADGRATACEKCHQYPTWSGASGGHTATSNCVSCHAARTPANHRADGRATACEKCHQYPTWSGASGGHTATSNCVSCHSSKTPANHQRDGRTSKCENCHQYPDWGNASFSHSGVSSGCANCHSKHYSGYACEACHTSGISWSYRHSRVRSDGCVACHDGDGHGDGHGDDDDDD